MYLILETIAMHCTTTFMKSTTCTEKAAQRCIYPYNKNSKPLQSIELEASAFHWIHVLSTHFCISLSRCLKNEFYQVGLSWVQHASLLTMRKSYLRLRTNSCTVLLSYIGPAHILNCKLYFCWCLTSAVLNYWKGFWWNGLLYIVKAHHDVPCYNIIRAGKHLHMRCSAWERSYIAYHSYSQISNRIQYACHVSLRKHFNSAWHFRGKLQNSHWEPSFQWHVGDTVTNVQAINHSQIFWRNLNLNNGTYCETTLLLNWETLL